jgi:nucleoid DNA-binding protein
LILPNSRYITPAGIAPEQIKMTAKQFARFVSRRKGVSSVALMSAITLITDGIIEALSEGFDVNFRGLGEFQVRLYGPRIRCLRFTREKYMAPPFTQVHFLRAKKLRETVKKVANQRIADLCQTPTLPVVGEKRKKT